jgi:hypothetical protein
MSKSVKESYTNQIPLFFIHIPKTAGTSIENFGEKHNFIWGRFYNFEMARESQKYCNRWHIPPKYFENNIGWNIYFENKIPFTIVRNPYTRIISEYLYITYNPSVIGLNEFVKSILTKHWSDHDCHIIPQSEYTYAPIIENNQVIWVQNTDQIEILKFEKINTEFKELLNKYGYDYTVNPLSKDRPPGKGGNNEQKITLEYLTPISIQIINEMYHEDFVNFGYDKITSIENFTMPNTIWMENNLKKNDDK